MGVTISSVGKPREPITNGDALFSIILNTTMIILIIHYFM